MKKFFPVFLALTIFNLSCDDGDIITTYLDFDDVNLQTCGELVFYKTKDDTNETLSLKLTNPQYTFIAPVNDTIPVEENNILFVDENGEGVKLATINGTSNTFNYRTYSSEPDNVFCNDVPPSNIDIQEDLSSDTGHATITTTLTEDDNDGIPSEDEDVNGDGNLDNDDTDGDGIPNYLDEDDDGDNVYTIDEIDFDEETDELILIDTDEDEIPNYLDSDDDGDNVNTIDEENLTQDNNPTNDVTTPGAGPDYLNPLVATTVTAAAYREHNIYQTYTIKVEVEDILLPGLTQDYFDMGDIEFHDEREVTPEFGD